MISIFCFGLLTSLGCNRKTEGVQNEQSFTDTQYIVTLKDGYSMKDLRSTLGSQVNHIGPSSKTENVYLITLNQALSIDELLAFPFVESAIRPNDKLDEPMQSQPVQKGTSSPIKKKN